MIEEKKSSTIRYLTFDQIRVLYQLFFRRFQEIGEPIPDWSFINQENIKHLIEIPKGSFFGVERYKTIESKAAAIFYHINKGHIFPNGNKRLSVACAVTFLILNGYELTIDADAMTKKALEIANSDPNDFEKVKKDLAEWIKSSLIEY